MASSLAKQLSQVAVNSTNTLNLKAQKVAHSKSLIFEPRVAASQSFDTLYTLCHEGFEELCLLDGRFLEFQRNLFSEQSQDEDRTVMTEDDNSALDKRLESFLGLVASRLRLNPAIKAVEWLVRRFRYISENLTWSSTNDNLRIHEYNTLFVLTTFLPYHTLPIFTTLLSILPANIPAEYTFLQPYIRSVTQPMRHAIVHAATAHASFAAVLNSYVLRICNYQQHYPALLAFWAGIMTEATSGMLDKSRSGRRGVQQQNEQDVMLRILPTLNEGLAMKAVPELRLGCYMLLTVMASKGGLDDKLLTAMMSAVALGWSTETVSPGLVCLSVLAQHRGAKQITKLLTKELLKVENLSGMLLELSKQRRVEKLANGLCLSLVDRLKSKGDTSGLPIIVRVIENQLISDIQTAVLFKFLLLAAEQIDDVADTKGEVRSRLAASLVTITRLSGPVAAIISGVLKDTDTDIDMLEMKLHISIRPAEQPLSLLEDTEMEDGLLEKKVRPSFTDIFEKIPTRTATETSFLSHKPSHIYHDLCQAFIASTEKESNLKLFDEAPVLRRSTALQDDMLYLSFYIRTWCEPYPVMVRYSALQMATACLSRSNVPNIDVQMVLPYAISALADPATKVRRAAAELLVAMNKIYPTNLESKKQAKQFQQWGLELYERESVQSILSVDVVIRCLREMLIPAMEECVLDAKHIESLFQKSLNSVRTSEIPSKQEVKGLSKAARLSIMSFLSSHATNTPLYTVKLRLLSVLNQVRSVDGTNRTKFLLPILQEWASLSPKEALRHCQDANFEPDKYNEEALSSVVANDKEGLQFLTNIISGQVAADRPDFVEAVFERLRTIWSAMKGDMQLQLAQTLLNLSQSSSPEGAIGHVSSAEASAGLLQTVPLSTTILLSFLEQLPTAANLADKPSTPKRRRTSHGEVARAPLQDSKVLAAAIRKVTFVLQLVDGSGVENHPELLRDLFNTLAELQHFKAQVSSELAYLQGLVLGSLLTILKAHKSDASLKLDHAAVRPDLLVDCVQKTSSPQVQNAALLLIASLAEMAPEIVLHSVMPIFTFMGTSVLRQNDEYSAHVINQTIREVIPPLVASLRKEKGNPVTGAAELLLSFVAAFEHVPPHRRKTLLTSLVQTLGAEEFLFAILAMLINKYGPTDATIAFAVDLASTFSVEVQLQSAIKHLDLVSDMLRPKPTYSVTLLSANEETIGNLQQSALNQLSFLPLQLSQRRLVSQTGKLLKQDDMDAAQIREHYAILLENLLALADTVKEHDGLHGSCGDILQSLLGLLSTSEFVKSVEGLLDRPNESLRRKILHSLEVRVEHESASDAVSRAAMLGFLPQLTAIIRESKDTRYKHIAVGCVDKISEKYGKKDLESVAAAAQTIASDHCLGQSDNRLRVMALLCLASLVEILKDGLVPVLPIAIPRALEYMEDGLKGGTEGQKLHNAAYAFISSLVEHLPYMVSGAYLDKLLVISNKSAEGDLDDEADESRVQCLQLSAKKLDAKNIFMALEKNWDSAVTAGTLVSLLNYNLRKLADISRRFVNILMF
jgi:U3 small nucleolar RNA-associated protein 10